MVEVCFPVFDVRPIWYFHYFPPGVADPLGEPPTEQSVVGALNGLLWELFSQAVRTVV